MSFKKYRIAIFVDSEFFHGKNWEIEEKRPKSNSEFWKKKIERNIQRDYEVNDYLVSRGWTVLRFWSEDIRKSLFKIVNKIESHIKDRENLINYKSKTIALSSGNYLQSDDLLYAAEPTSNYKE